MQSAYVCNICRSYSIVPLTRSVNEARYYINVLSCDCECVACFCCYCCVLLSTHAQPHTHNIHWIDGTLWLCSCEWRTRPVIVHVANSENAVVLVSVCVWILNDYREPGKIWPHRYSVLGVAESMFVCVYMLNGYVLHVNTACCLNCMIFLFYFIVSLGKFYFPVISTRNFCSTKLNRTLLMQPIQWAQKFFVFLKIYPRKKNTELHMLRSRKSVWCVSSWIMSSYERIRQNDENFIYLTILRKCKYLNVQQKRQCYSNEHFF